MAGGRSPEPKASGRHPSDETSKQGRGGEYEPRDSRNVTGTASTPDGRWTSKQRNPPPAAG